MHPMQVDTVIIGRWQCDPAPERRPLALIPHKSKGRHSGARSLLIVEEAKPKRILYVGVIHAGFARLSAGTLPGPPARVGAVAGANARSFENRGNKMRDSHGSVTVIHYLPLIAATLLFIDNLETFQNIPSIY